MYWWTLNTNTSCYNCYFSAVCPVYYKWKGMLTVLIFDPYECDFVEQKMNETRSACVGAFADVVITYMFGFLSAI